MSKLRREAGGETEEEANSCTDTIDTHSEWDEDDRGSMDTDPSTIGDDAEIEAKEIDSSWDGGWPQVELKEADSKWGGAW